MIQFEQIDSHLEKLGKSRSWLALETGRSAGAIGSALAPNAQPKHRSTLLQKALTDAIMREEERQRNIPAPAAHLPDRVTVECSPEERRNWEAAAQAKRTFLDAWIVGCLNIAASRQLGLPATVSKMPAHPSPHALPDHSDQGNGTEGKR